MIKKLSSDVTRMSDLSGSVRPQYNTVVGDGTDQRSSLEQARFTAVRSSNRTSRMHNEDAENEFVRKMEEFER